MARRTVYRVNNEAYNYVKKIEVDFEWSPGFSICQKQKSIKSLHENYAKNYKQDKILEISSKSLDELGISLSAFNLMISTKTNKKEFSVECAFQSSKVFEYGGPYKDLLGKTSREAKKDERLKTSGELIGFEFFDRKWEIEPKTLFYDWLYINALYRNQDLAQRVLEYDAFTDIEFNPKKSINCQASSAALFVSLSRMGLLENAISSEEEYKKIIINRSNSEQSLSYEQGTFL
ncbi:MAG: hypothetical protein E6371_10740 [Terrisporobacter othiniensis]|uniref:DarT1-associated NADAR antitoxin family protein n=1 Tax=Terrisporobacter othiniensis TaxID=1577792 RepID=UPI0029077C15|nr:hypothetical protein [Terrisporobacter othiniensis]MDU6984882.1 hypothetical protein [Terrisporobacter othiniensis]